MGNEPSSYEEGTEQASAHTEQQVVPSSSNPITKRKGAPRIPILYGKPGDETDQTILEIDEDRLKNCFETFQTMYEETKKVSFSDLPEKEAIIIGYSYCQDRDYSGAWQATVNAVHKFDNKHVNDVIQAIVTYLKYDHDDMGAITIMILINSLSDPNVRNYLKNAYSPNRLFDERDTLSLDLLKWTTWDRKQLFPVYPTQYNTVGKIISILWNHEQLKIKLVSSKIKELAPFHSSEYLDLIMGMLKRRQYMGLAHVYEALGQFADKLRRPNINKFIVAIGTDPWNYCIVHDDFEYYKKLLGQVGAKNVNFEPVGITGYTEKGPVILFQDNKHAAIFKYGKVNFFKKNG